MAKIFDKIVQSATEPSKNDIWLKDGQLKAFQNGQWKSLSPQGTGGEGGEEVEVSSEHPVRIIELTQEELMTGKELDITYEEYINNQYIIKANLLEQVLYFHKETTIMDRDVNVQYYDVYSCSIIGNMITTVFSCSIYYKYGHKIYISSVSNDGPSIPNILLNFNDDPNILSKLQQLSLNYSYTVGLVTDVYSIIIGTYYNGTITAIVDNRLRQYDVDFETGAISESLSIDLNTLAGLEARVAALEGA